MPWSTFQAACGTLDHSRLGLTDPGQGIQASKRILRRGDIVSVEMREPRRELRPARAPRLFVRERSGGNRSKFADFLVEDDGSGLCRARSLPAGVENGISIRKGIAPSPTDSRGGSVQAETKPRTHGASPLPTFGAVASGSVSCTSALRPCSSTLTPFGRGASNGESSGRRSASSSKLAGPGGSAGVPICKEFRRLYAGRSASPQKARGPQPETDDDSSLPLFSAAL